MRLLWCTPTLPHSRASVILSVRGPVPLMNEFESTFYSLGSYSFIQTQTQSVRLVATKCNFNSYSVRVLFAHFWVHNHNMNLRGSGSVSVRLVAPLLTFTMVALTFVHVSLFLFLCVPIHVMQNGWRRRELLNKGLIWILRYQREQ